MTTRYFFITTKYPKIVRYSEGLTEVFQVDKGWVAQEEWHHRIFFGDFTDYEEVTEKEATMFILGMTAL